MQGVEGAHGRGKRFPCAIEHGLGELDERNARQKGAGVVAVDLGRAAGMDAIPDLEFEQPAGNEVFEPEALRGTAAFREDVRQGNGSIEVDQGTSRSARSSSSSPITSSNFIVG